MKSRVPYFQGRPLYDKSLEPPMPRVSRFNRTDRRPIQPRSHDLALSPRPVATNALAGQPLPVGERKSSGENA